MKKKEVTEEEIARVAYEIYERRGTGGRETEDWFEAEQIVVQRCTVRKPARKAGVAAVPKKKGATGKKSAA